MQLVQIHIASSNTPNQSLYDFGLCAVYGIQKVDKMKT